MSVSMNHPSHPGHQFEHQKQVTTIFTCSGCEMPGFGERFRCMNCDKFSLHVTCMEAHTRHPTRVLDLFGEGEHTFQYYDRPRPGPPCLHKKCKKADCEGYIITCSACGQDVKGFQYHCPEKGWDLHPCCAQLKSELQIGGVKFKLHKIPRFQDPKTIPTCMWCDGKSKPTCGSVYVSDSWKPESIHVNCFMKEAIKHGNDPITTQNLSLALQGLPLRTRPTRSGESSESFAITALKTAMKTILSTVIGDPSALFASVLVDVLFDVVNRLR